MALIVARTTVLLLEVGQYDSTDFDTDDVLEVLRVVESVVVTDVLPVKKKASRPEVDPYLGAFKAAQPKAWTLESSLERLMEEEGLLQEMQRSVVGSEVLRASRVESGRPTSDDVDVADSDRLAGIHDGIDL